MLNGKLTLHGLEDVESFCRKIISERWQLSHTNETTSAYLIAECWRLSTNYEPSPEFKFSTYVTPILRNRAIDWFRKERG